MKYLYIHKKTDQLYSKHGLPCTENGDGFLLLDSALDKRAELFTDKQLSRDLEIAKYDNDGFVGIVGALTL